MRTRALVRERAQRNLLLLIDGSRSDATLLSDMAGISAADFQALQALGLITPTGVDARRDASASPRAAPAVAAEPAPLDYAQFTAALTKLIANELGLRGFVLTLALEKASNDYELQAVAQRALAQIRQRKGDAAAAAAGRTLYGVRHAS